MPDITMCTGGACPVKKYCYRYTAKPKQVQSFMFPPFKYVDGNIVSCKYMIDTRKSINPNSFNHLS